MNDAHEPIDSAQPASTSAAIAPANWYVDPQAADLLRWWDGSQWTEHTSPNVAALVEGPASTAGPFVDLADNRAGQAAAAKAAEIRAAEPKRGFFRRLFGPPSGAASWEKGVAGERVVGQRLAKLPDGWFVLHAVPVGSGDSDIDHVVIGPGGVFTINTKNHSGGNVWIHTKAFKVNGTSQPYLRNSRHEAQRATKLLSAACGFEVDVVPVIAVLCRQLTVKDHPEDVRVMEDRDVTRWLKRRRQQLSPEQVAFVYERARRVETWRTT